MKPGQLKNIDGKFLRCMKREYGCDGCILNDILLCPRLVRNRNNPPQCIEDGIIFVKPC